jgi:predicted RNA binding protein YcfA (HicA-like mRNA interferase family)
VTKVPELSYRQVVHALQRCGFVVVRQRGSHIRLQKHIVNKTIKIIVPAHSPVKRTTLAKVIKASGISVSEFNRNL